MVIEQNIGFKQLKFYTKINSSSTDLKCGVKLPIFTVIAPVWGVLISCIVGSHVTPSISWKFPSLSLFSSDVEVYSFIYYSHKVLVLVIALMSNKRSDEPSLHEDARAIT